MKIIILGPAYPFRGGLATFNERLARAYQEAGHQVKIYTFTVQYPSLVFPGKSQYNPKEAPRELHIERLVNSVNPLNWRKAGKRIGNEQADLLIVRYWLPLMAPALGTICKIAGRRSSTRIVAIVDNIVPHEKRPGDHPLTRYFVKQMHGFLVMSASVSREIDRYDKTKKRIYSPHPIYDVYGPELSREEAREALGLDKEMKYILFFGFIRDYKGLDWLLEAFSETRFRKLNVRLIIAGEFYSDEKAYQHLIDVLELRPYLHLYTHFIPDSEVNKYFSAADLVVQPYKNATQSGVTQIAYHYNKPMIVTNVGGLAEMVRHDVVGYVTRPHSAAIADAIFEFFTAGKEKEFIANIREEKKKFSWKYFVEKLNDLAFA